MYFHGTLGDTLWFASWAPSSAGSFFAACFVLFVLGVLDRFLAAVRAMSESRWQARYVPMVDCPSHDHVLTRLSFFLLSTQELLSSTPRAPFYLSPSSSLEKGLTQPSTANSVSAEEDQITTVTSAENHQTAAQRPSPFDLLPHRKTRWAPPFVWKVEVMRGLYRALQTAIHYILM